MTIDDLNIKVQEMREEGDSDLRTVLYYINQVVSKPKQLTIEELREQFRAWYKDFYEEEINVFWVQADGQYRFETVEVSWQSYLSCARANNIIKESK